MTVYWLQIDLQAAEGTCTADELGAIGAELAGVMRTSHTSGDCSVVTDGDLLTLGVSIDTEASIADVPAQVVGIVRAAIHGLGHATPGWPEPVTIDDIRQIKVLAPAHC
jgi:hypothetical protein